MVWLRLLLMATLEVMVLLLLSPRVAVVLVGVQGVVAVEFLRIRYKVSH